jgi:hypothetical protein
MFKVKKWGKIKTHTGCLSEEGVGNKVDEANNWRNPLRCSCR